MQNKYITKILNTLEWIVKIAIMISLIIMVLLVFLNATMRYIFNSGIVESEELSRYFFIWTVFLGTILGFKNNVHIGVDLVVSKLKGIPKKVFITIADILSLFAIYVMYRGGVIFTGTVVGVKSPATGLPQSIFTTSIIIASVAISLIILWKIFKRWTTKEQGDN